MPGSGRALGIYTGLLTLGALVVTALAVVQDPERTWRLASDLAWADLLTFAILAAGAELWTVYLPRVSGSVDVSDSLYFALMLLSRPGVTAGILVVAALVKAIRGYRQPQWTWVTRLFSAVAAIIPFGLGALVFDRLQRDNASLEHSGSQIYNLLVLLGSAVIVYGLLAFELAIYRALERKIRFYPQMLPLRRMGWQMVSMVPLGLLLAVTRQVDALAFYLLVIPLIVMFVTLKEYSELLQEAKETIEGLANAVERRNPSTLQHSDRVAQYAEETARELKMREEEIEAIRSAGKLHDLGKISIADSILVKMEALDEDEFEEIRRSPEVGGRVAGSLSLFQTGGNVGEIVHQHHEWYNGKGYPRGLKGEDIMLAARILAVAEAFDSMTTDRIYRDPMTWDDASQELTGGAGEQFDPRVVEAFLSVIKRKQRTAGGRV